MQLTFFTNTRWISSTNTRWISSTSAILRNVKPGGYNKSSFPIINKEDYEILYGLLLGDAYISRKNTENASLRFEQSIINKDYLEHLFNKFSYLATKNVSMTFYKK